MTQADGDSLLEDRVDPPGSVGHLRDVGCAAARRRQFDAAAAAFQSWTVAEPTNAEAWLSLARVQVLAGLRSAAKQSCEHALERDPALFRGHWLLYRLATAAEDGKSRVAALKAAVALRPTAFALRLKLAGLMLRRIQHKAAMAVSKEALALRPGHARALLGVARCHLALGHLADAETFLERAGQAEGAGAIAGDGQRLRHEIVVRRARAAAERTGQNEAEAPGFVARSAPAAEPITLGPAPPVVPADVAELVHPGASNVEASITPALLRRIDRDRHGPGLIDHLLIVRALILRDIRLHHRDNSFGFLLDLVRPAVVIFVHYWMFFFLHKPMPAQIPIEIFVLAGFTVWFAFNAAWLGASTGGKWPGGVTALPGVTNLHLRVAKAAWGVLLNLAFCLLAILPLSLVDRGLPLPNVPESCIVFALAGLLGFGLGLILERLGQVFAFMKTAEKLLSWALFVTSGLYFSIQTTPPLVAEYFLWNPLLHLVDFERHAFDAGYPVALLDLKFPACGAVLLLVTGLLLHGGLRCPADD